MGCALLELDSGSHESARGERSAHDENARVNADETVTHVIEERRTTPETQHVYPMALRLRDSRSPIRARRGDRSPGSVAYSKIGAEREWVVTEVNANLWPYIKGVVRGAIPILQVINEGSAEVDV
jgi:hypothetical protein